MKYKFVIRNKEESRRLQEHVFALGGGWGTRRKRWVNHTDEPFLYLDGYPPMLTYDFQGSDNDFLENENELSIVDHFIKTHPIPIRRKPISGGERAEKRAEYIRSEEAKGYRADISAGLTEMQERRISISWLIEIQGSAYEAGFTDAERYYGLR